MKAGIGENDSDVIALWMSWWSDSFEPNTSNKGNRKSVWIKTITISKPSNTAGTCMVHTFPIAIGPKNGDKEPVERAIQDDLSLLSEKQRDLPCFYDYRRRRMVKVVAKVALCIHDQLDRRSTLTLQQGNSTYHAMFGWSYDFTKNHKVVAPCMACTVSIMEEDEDWRLWWGTRSGKQYDWRSGRCPNCTGWFFHQSSELLRYPVPSELKSCYPTTSTIGPIKLSFPTLRKVVQLSHDKYKADEWTKKETHCYLKQHCITEKYITKFMAHCENAKLLQQHINIGETEGNVNRNDFNTIQDEADKYPAEFERVPYPALWDNDEEIPLKYYTETGMHLLFLGVVETTTKQVHDWCTRRRSGKQFIEYGEKVLSELASLGLPWLKIMKYSNTGRFGGWVSENYLGFSRFIPWFYSVIDEMTDAVPYVQPSKSVDQWNKIECKAWMRQKGVSGYDKYTLTQLRHYINDNLNKLTNVNIGTPGKWRSKTVMEKN